VAGPGRNAPGPPVVSLSTMPLRLSVLDLVPVREGQSSAQAIASSLRHAEEADLLGFERFWFAEHHNMPAVASTSPAVLDAMVLSRTARIRVGSGGVMLPNHSPFVIAEQFALLEAAAPGRVDLGLGRAPGSEPIVRALLASGGHASSADAFDDNVADLIALLQPGGAQLRIADGRNVPIRATPASASVPEIWILGSSDYSALLAARMGLPYAFAHHFSMGGTEHAIDLYRRRFEASQHLSAPRVLVTANVVAAQTAEEAEARALPHLRYIGRLRTGGPLGPQLTVEQAQREEPSFEAAAVSERARREWIVGDAQQAQEGLRALSERMGTDEIMISVVAAAREGEDLDLIEPRNETLRLVAPLLS